MKSAKVKVSVIVPVYNGEKTIRACLNSLLKQTVPTEIVVVDDGSKDQTRTILEQEFGTKIKLVSQRHEGPAKARNRGAELASAEILAFADADMSFAPDYLEKLIQPIEAGEAIGTFTTEEYVANWENVWARCWNWEEGWEPRKRFPPNPPLRGTDFRAILKEKFLAVGGFDNTGYTDSWTLFQKLGVRPLATKARCYHANPDNLKAVFLQARWVAKRPYKAGLLGKGYALLRTSLPVSLGVGLVKAVRYRCAAFMVFKIVYDGGRFWGIIESFWGSNLVK